VLEGKQKPSSCLSEGKFLIICLLFLAQAVSCPFAQAEGLGLAVRPTQPPAHYHERAKQLLDLNPALARQYADSMMQSAAAAADSSSLTEALKLMGDICAQQANYAQAVAWFHKGLELAVKRKDRVMAVRIHNNLGGVYHRTSQYDKALSQYNKSYSLGRSVLTPVQKAMLLNNLGLIYTELKQYQQAEMYLLEALELNTQTDNALGMGQACNNLGLLSKKRGKLEEAKSYFIRARLQAERINRPAGIAYALNNLADVYLGEQRGQEALPLLYASLNIKKQTSDRLGLCNTHHTLGKAWLALGRADSALFHYQTANLFADTVNNVHRKVEALTGMATSLAALGQLAAVAPLYTRILSLKDSAFHQERAAQLAMAQAEQELTQKEETIQLLTDEAAEASNKARYQEILLFLSLPLLLLLVLMVVFYLLRYRSERKAHDKLQLHHQEIQEQKAQIEQQHHIIQAQNAELQGANTLIEHYNSELQEVNERLEDKIRERTRALTDTYRKLAFHINNTPLAVLEWNKKLELVRWPEQAEQIFGYSPHEMLGKKAGMLPFLQDHQHRRFLERIQQEGGKQAARQVSFQQELTKADGQPLFVEWSHSVLTDDWGNVESVLSIANDVSLREQAFKEISLINQELDTFIYKASHDLRGPIARMQGIINLGKLESSDPNAHFYFDLLHNVSNELNNLLIRLLMVHNIHQHLLCLEDISFRGFVDTLIADLPVEKKNKHFTFYNSIPDTLRIESDKNLLSIILVNLLDNSLTFADNVAPYVVVSARVLPGSKLMFKVQDNGPGISEKMHEKVFDMFFQGSTKSTGVGLGLYMVRKAVRKFGGEVILDRQGGLTTFTVILPESDLMRIVPVPNKRKVVAA
jgi:PAS domain S-box-containing protein